MHIVSHIIIWFGGGIFLIWFQKRKSFFKSSISVSSFFSLWILSTNAVFPSIHSLVLSSRYLPKSESFTACSKRIAFHSLATRTPFGKRFMYRIIFYMVFMEVFDITLMFYLRHDLFWLVYLHLKHQWSIIPSYDSRHQGDKHFNKGVMFNRPIGVFVDDWLLFVVYILLIYVEIGNEHWLLDWFILRT